MNQKELSQKELLQARDDLLNVANSFHPIISSIVSRINTALITITNIPEINKPQFEKEILDYNDLKDITGYTKNTLYSMVCRNEIPILSGKGKNARFSKTEIDRWIEDMKIPSKKQVLSGDKKIT